MRKLLVALTLVAAPLTPMHAVAAPVAAAPAKPLDRLVALLLPEKSLLQLAGRAFDTGVGREMASDPTLKLTQARHPGLKSYVTSQLRPAFLKAMKKEIPSLRREIRAIVADGLTPAETSDSLAFFASPTGAKLRVQVYTAMAEKPDQPPEAMQAAVMSAVMANMKVADYPALIAFGASPAANKMNALNPRISAASKAWSDRLVAKHSARMRSLAAAATKRYLAGKR